MPGYVSGVKENKFDLIPFHYAKAEWDKLTRIQDKYDRQLPSSSANHPGCCPICHAPEGEHGFLRMHFPIGHPLFGRAICCPRCWPHPFGDAPDGYLSEKAQRIAAIWRMVKEV